MIISQQQCSRVMESASGSSSDLQIQIHARVRDGRQCKGPAEFRQHGVVPTSSLNFKHLLPYMTVVPYTSKMSVQVLMI